jgi:hypothetical protein
MLRLIVIAWSWKAARLFRFSCSARGYVQSYHFSAAEPRDFCRWANRNVGAGRAIVC